MRELRGLAFLSWLTFRRQLAGYKSLVAFLLIGTICLLTLFYARRHFPGASAESFDEGEMRDQVARFTRRIVMLIYVRFLLPILGLIYATAALGEEREDRTLIHVLIRPLARYRIYLAKGLGVLPLALIAGVGGFWLICASAGVVGQQTWSLFWPAVVRGCIAYVCLFLLFGALLPRPAVLAVLYAFFCETLLGSMPGTIKRVALSFHCRCIMYDAGEPIGLTPFNPARFLPISGESAAWVLTLASLSLLAVGAFFFHRKDYEALA